MSKRDVDNYFNQICDTYSEMLDNLKDLAVEASNNMISPEAFERYKATIEPIKTNYERWSYMMYLLNKPNRKSKQKCYDNQHNKEVEFFNKHGLIDVDLNESREILSKIKLK